MVLISKLTYVSFLFCIKLYHLEIVYCIMVIEMEDLIELYKNYLFALREREEYGNKYGDTDEIIKMYEKKLKFVKDKKK